MMVRNVQMRLVVCLVLASCCLCEKSKSNTIGDGNNEKKLVQDPAKIESSSERQFINTLRKWLFRQGDDDKMEEKKSQIKLLPVYIPVPVYSDHSSHANNDFYGAYPQRPEDYEALLNTPNHSNHPSLPYSHSPFYDLPYTGHLHRQTYPYYWPSRPEQADFSTQYQAHHRFPHTYPFGGEYNYPYESSYEAVSYQEPENHDSVVVENPDLTDDTTNQNDGEDYTRKRKKFYKKTTN